MAESHQKVRLLGVAHSPKWLDEVLGALLPKLRPGQSVGLEVFPEKLAEFEELFAQEMRRQAAGLPPTSFSEAYLDFVFSRLQEILSKVVGQKKAEALVSNVKRKAAENANIYQSEVAGNKFFYELFKAVKNKGGKVIPLESKRLRDAAAIAAYRTQFAKKQPFSEPTVANLAKLSSLMAFPAREFWLVRRLKTMPDFIVFGSQHLDGINSWLKRRKVRSKVIYYRKPSEAELDIARESRRIYRQRKKERLAKRLEARKGFKPRLPR